MHEINKYIEKRYSRWLDYSLFHCTQAGIVDQANDVLNEVVVALLEKDKNKITHLFVTKKGKYRQLDFYVLRMIKLNIYSPTSPYQSKYRQVSTVPLEFERLNIFEKTEIVEDKPAIILNQCNQVRDTFEGLNLSIKARDIFEHRFIQGLPFSQWPGPESARELYETYNKVIKMIKDKINGRSLL